MLLSELVMERKPIKRREELMQLSKEHHFSLLFCWKIRQGLKMNISFDRIKKYMQYFWLQCMQPHFLEEENFLFNSVEDEKVKKALSDHRQIEVLISDAMVAEETNVSEQLSKLANLVEAHVRYEERELFPHLEKELSATQLKHIGEQLNQTSPSEDDFEDAFWATKK